MVGLENLSIRFVPWLVDDWLMFFGSSNTLDHVGHLNQSSQVCLKKQ